MVTLKQTAIIGMMSMAIATPVWLFSKTVPVEKVTVWGIGISPYVRKTLVALEEKGIPYTLNETLPVSLLNATGQTANVDFLAASPLGKIPAIQYGQDKVADSTIIASYLDQKFSQKKLYPENPSDYAAARWFEYYSDNVLSTVVHAKILVERVVKPNVLQISADEDLVTYAINHELPPMLNYLNSSLEGKQWFAGDQFSMADIAVTTQILALDMADVKITTDGPWPLLAKHTEKVLARESFQAVLSQ